MRVHFLIATGPILRLIKTQFVPIHVIDITRISDLNHVFPAMLRAAKKSFFSGIFFLTMNCEPLYSIIGLC